MWMSMPSLLSGEPSGCTTRCCCCCSMSWLFACSIFESLKFFEINKMVKKGGGWELGREKKIIFKKINKLKSKREKKIRKMSVSVIKS